MVFYNTITLFINLETHKAVLSQMDNTWADSCNIHHSHADGHSARIASSNFLEALQYDTLQCSHTQHHSMFTGTKVT